MLPFILRSARPINAGASSIHDEAIWDPQLQYWTLHGKPLVASLLAGSVASSLGETTITETGEGADQAERVSLRSNVGETTFTKTREGTDQTEICASTLGETIKTATGEGTDQTERVHLPVR